MVSISPDYMSCTEDFDIAAVAEMMHADDVRSFEEAPMEQDTIYMAECICCVGNVHQEASLDTSAKVSSTRHVRFEMDEISATSTKESEYHPDTLEPADASPVIRRSSRIESNTRKRRSSEMSPSKVSIRKRKSTSSLDKSTSKIRRTSSFGRASKSPATVKGSNKKVTKKRNSTGRRQSGKFNKK